MFTSDTLTPITAELLRKNNWNGVFDIPKNRQYAFVADYDGKEAKLVNNVVWNGLDVILTDEWTFTLEDIDLTKTPSETDLIAKVSTLRYMEDLAFLLDLCHISWVNLKF